MNEWVYQQFARTRRQSPQFAPAIALMIAAVAVMVALIATLSAVVD